MPVQRQVGTFVGKFEGHESTYDFEAVSEPIAKRLRYAFFSLISGGSGPDFPSPPKNFLISNSISFAPLLNCFACYVLFLINLS
jgi:hypothetical protein